MGYLYLLFGQALGIGWWWTKWKTPDQPWPKYWVNGHLAQHLHDLILTIIVFLGWSTGLLAEAMKLVGAEQWAEKLPETPKGAAALVFTGAVMSFVVGLMNKWLAKKADTTP